MIEAWFLARPSWLRKVIIVIGALLAMAAAFSAWLYFHDRGVIAQHIQAEQVKDAVAREKSTEDRAVDAVQGAAEHQQRVDAIDAASRSEQAKEPSARAALSPQDMALACARLRQVYTPKELAEMSAYQEKCR